MRVRSIGGLAAVLLFLFSAACGGTTAPSAPASSSPLVAFPVTLTDDDGESITIPSEPQRIVTFAPSMTEIVYALGLGDRLVGVAGPFDDYPVETTTIEQVGGAGEFGVDPNAEKVVSLEPDLFLTIAGGDQWKDRLRDLGIPIVTLNATDFPDLLHDIRVVGEVTGAVGAADQLTADMQAKADAIDSRVSTEGTVSCFFEVYWGPPLTTIGPNTFIFDLLERAGCDPVTASASSDYPSWSVDDLVAEGPDVYLATPESAKSVGSIGNRPGFDGIPAVADGSVVLVDSDLVTRPGPRVVDGLEELADALHPGTS